MKMIRCTLVACMTLVVLAACQNGPEQAAAPKFDGIAKDEVIRFTGTEPFWGGQVEGTMLTYSTPENIDGETIAIKRFAGNHGLGLSGKLGEAAFDMTVTPGECSDGMSDRVYPFTVTLSIDGEMREGCGWTDREPFSGPENP
ncbi:COG3650 family protein [Allopontixanthobacter sediminis]|uniref:Lipoprotein n=1 Tax=Allopontixanthobacter sediminis TaxID=1689985 RepID=A0A845B5A7_9SPHN|nr:hypothetical protein [Allopontixanthobacter sediminis]MXP45618.1 hypothetical protein [Allopontixanthobacter sediminis]